MAPKTFAFLPQMCVIESKPIRLPKFIKSSCHHFLPSHFNRLLTGLNPPILPLAVQTLHCNQTDSSIRKSLPCYFSILFLYYFFIHLEDEIKTSQYGIQVFQAISYHPHISKDIAHSSHIPHPINILSNAEYAEAFDTLAHAVDLSDPDEVLGILQGQLKYHSLCEGFGPPNTVRTVKCICISASGALLTWLWNTKVLSYFFLLSPACAILMGKDSDGCCDVADMQHHTWHMLMLKTKWFSQCAPQCSVKSLSHVQLLAIPLTVQSASLLCPWDSPGKNTGVDCHSLLQRIFPTQGWNLGLLHCRQMPYLPICFFISSFQHKVLKLCLTVFSSQVLLGHCFALIFDQTEKSSHLSHHHHPLFNDLVVYEG